MSKMNSNKHRSAVFLDRDGTINVEKNYLHKTSDFEFIPGSLEAIKKLKDAGFLVIVVTNQSGIARGYFDENSVVALHEYVQSELQLYRTSIDAFYFCPHHPQEGLGDYKCACKCRKGEPGMLLQAAEEHDIDLSRSFMVGDKTADVEAGIRAGCKSILVMTGYGLLAKLKTDVLPVKKCKDLSAAAEYILSKCDKNTGCD